MLKQARLDTLDTLVTTRSIRSTLRTCGRVASRRDVTRKVETGLKYKNSSNAQTDIMDMSVAVRSLFVRVKECFLTFLL